MIGTINNMSDFLVTNINQLCDIVDIKEYRLDDPGFRAQCKETLDREGVLVLRNFLTKASIESIKQEGDEHKDLAYYTSSKHNIYLSPADNQFPSEHPRNRSVTSSKGCITTDQIPAHSDLHTLYNSSEFTDFLCSVLDEAKLFEYADPLSSVNLHYAEKGQELGWHFDNSSFAITLMIQAPEQGGQFEYVKNVRNADQGEMNYDFAGKVLDGDIPVKNLSMDSGALVLFRGRNSMHRVTPAQGSRTRMLVVLAYNTEPGVALSESARMTFYGRLG